MVMCVGCTVIRNLTALGKKRLQSLIVVRMFHYLLPDSRRVKIWVGVAIHYAGGLINTELVVRGVDSRKRDHDDLLNHSHNQCQYYAFRHEHNIVSV